MYYLRFDYIDKNTTGYLGPIMPDNPKYPDLNNPRIKVKCLQYAKALEKYNKNLKVSVEES